MVFVASYLNYVNNWDFGASFRKREKGPLYKKPEPGSSQIRPKPPKMSRSVKVQSQLRDQFIDFTDTTSSVAESFLKAANYDLELAINNFLSYQASGTNGDNKSLGAIFDRYKDSERSANGQEVIGIDGTLQYLEDLGIEPEDRVTLALAEFLESPSVGVFEKRKFILKWQSVHALLIKDMKEYLQQLDVKLTQDTAYLKKVYQFAFKFLLEDGQKTLPLETAIEYWNLLLGPQYGDKVDPWVDFLQKEWKQAISRDAWNMFFVFLQDFVKDPKLENYDETAAWPSLIDEFVEYFKENQDK